MSGRALGERAFIGLQYLLPQHFLSRLVGMIAESRIGFVRTALIRAFLGRYPVDLSEAVHAGPADYRSFNDFFTRRLRAGARHFDPDPRAALCPVDGIVSQAGRIAGDTLLQAKGMEYSAAALLGGDPALAAEFAHGEFATLYLAPHNYHRVHMPLAGTLRIARFVPGDLFSVNAATAAGVPGLFARNERLACVFDTSNGPMAVVLVGALFVGSMSLAWTGRIVAPGRQRPRDLQVRDPIVALDRGAELGWFNMGSTVIVMFPAGGPALVDSLVPGRAVRVGGRLASPR
ncbi:MAG TPA: archaetidylserine decarboxylase [Steroidobacteraceae bacterium]